MSMAKTGEAGVREVAADAGKTEPQSGTQVVGLGRESSAADAAALLGDALGLDEGQTPFRWQTRLLQHFREGTIPRSLDVPTGLGKTATMAIWLVARALGGALPRRLVYVVDRRAVVDQATDVAEKLRQWVDHRPDVKAGLHLTRSLPVSTLRGQMVDNREWLEDPSAPAIVVGTVDLVGSRLLFEGYRASRRMRPYLAGLLGHDVLFVLDEAHLVPPFERLLERVTLEDRGLRGLRATDSDVMPPPRLLSLSATGRSRGGQPFELQPEDLDDREVQRRLSAKKKLSVEVIDPKADLAVAAAERVWRLAQEGARAARFVVFLTKREDAEKARGHLSKLAGLDKQKKGESPAAEVELLVGGRRVYERTEGAKRLQELGFIAGSRVERHTPTFLFATSAGEVGVDLDADHMVGDLVSWERFVQRLGRVNRRGFGDAEVVLLDYAGKEDGPEAHQARLAAVRELLSKLPKAEDGRRDVSPGALSDLQRKARNDDALGRLLTTASTPDPLFPALDRPTLDAWSMTSLKEHPGRPLVAPWLRGWVENRPQTSIVWRRFLPLLNGRLPGASTAKRYFDAAPLHASELLEAETSRAAEWLGKRAKRLLSRGKKAEASEDSLAADSIVCALIRGDGDDIAWLTLGDLADSGKRELERALNGADLVLDARFGGLSFGLLEESADEIPATLDGGELNPSPWSDVPYRVRTTADVSAVEDDVWRERERVPLERTEEGEVTSWLVVEKRTIDSSTEEDRSAGPPQTLSEHQAWTAREAEALAQRLGLPEHFARILGIAARLHDEGKQATRWQEAFNAARAAKELDQLGPFAKTRGPVNVGVLDGYRHEFGSLFHAERDEEVASLAPADRDLVLHLIAAHHGYARPYISVDGCDDAPPSALEARAREVALRFFRLQKEWGPWGLAWWEALLRSADQLASRANDRRDVKSRAKEAE